MIDLVNGLVTGTAPCYHAMQKKVRETGPPKRRIGSLRVRPYTLDDWPGRFRIQRERFPPPCPAGEPWSPDQIESHCRLFPDGALCGPGPCSAYLVRGETADPVTTPQIRSGLIPVQVIHGYLPDAESDNAALLLEWRRER